MRNDSAALVFGCVIFLTGSAVANAQAWRWRDDGIVEHVPNDRARNRWEREVVPWQWAPPPPRSNAFAPQRPMVPGAGPNEIRDGGERPLIMPVAPPVVAFHHGYPANSIVIDTTGRQLYYVLPGNKAFAYQISVGREGFNWTGTEAVSRKQDWPDWHPPAEMRARDPSLPEKMTGGLKNPLGASALYLGNTLYRIRGTNDEKSLGQAQSSGCFRMLNSNVVHLASITEIGTAVSVVEGFATQRVSGADRRSAQLPPPPAAGAPPPPWRRDFDRDRDRWLYSRPAPYGWR